MVQWCYGRTTLNGASHPLMLGNSIADVVHYPLPIRSIFITQKIDESVSVWYNESG
jgi:hypothetical protein